MTTITLEGTLKAICEKEKTLHFANGDCRMTAVSVETKDFQQIPIEIWGDKKIDFAKSNLGRNGLFVCELKGTVSKFTNSENEEVEFPYCRLKLKTMVPTDWTERE